MSGSDRDYVAVFTFSTFDCTRNFDYSLCSVYPFALALLTEPRSSLIFYSSSSIQYPGSIYRYYWNMVWTGPYYLCCVLGFGVRCVLSFRSFLVFSSVLISIISAVKYLDRDVGIDYFSVGQSAQHNYNTGHTKHCFCL